MTHSSREPYRPVLTTDADVTTMWRTLIRPLGWHTRRFYISFVDADGRPDVRLIELDEVPDDHSSADAVRLAELLLDILDRLGLAEGGGIALMFCRPGSDHVTEADRLVCRDIYAAAKATGLGLRLLHLGTDTAIVPMPMDEVLPRSA